MVSHVIPWGASAPSPEARDAATGGGQDGEVDRTGMANFMGTHRNRLDAKGRVSVPASFRACLRAPGDEPSLVLRPSQNHPCIEGWPAEVFATLEAPLATLDVFSEDQEDMASLLYSDAFQTDPDREGRIILPEPMVAFANLGEAVVFMGLGRIFQIWEPEAAERRRAEARERARQRGLTLPGRTPSPVGGPVA